jgi:fucose permease
MLATFHRYRSRLGLIALMFLAFISLGFPDGLLGVAWPTVRADFALPLDAIGLLLVSSTAGYLTSSFFSGVLVSRLGVGWVLALSCALTGLGLIGYTLAPCWGVMVALGVSAGFGGGAIDAALNTYVASRYGEGLMQWLHASYGVGVTLGPLVMTFGLTTFGAWRWGYVAVGVAQIALALSFILTLPMWRDGQTASSANHPVDLADYQTPILETLHQPPVWLSLALFFIYTGAEAALGVWTYSLLTEERGVDHTLAGFWTGAYWAMFTVGRLLAGLLTRHIGNTALVRGCLLAALAGSILLAWNPFSLASLLGVCFVGLAIAPLFPALVSGTVERVGRRFAANTIGMQVSAACVGAAALPSLLGVLARRWSLEVVPLGLIVAFLALFLLCSTPKRIKKDEGN